MGLDRKGFSRQISAPLLSGVVRGLFSLRGMRLGSRLTQESEGPPQAGGNCFLKAFNPIT